MRGRAQRAGLRAQGGEGFALRSEQGHTLIATLAAIAIMLLLAVALFKGSGAFGGKGGSTRADGKGTTVLGQARYKAFDTACQSNLKQDRQGIIVYQTTNDEAFPAKLEDIRFGSDFYRCPLGKEPYNYDPATGKVSCPHPGHEKY